MSLYIQKMFSGLASAVGAVGNDELGFKTRPAEEVTRTAIILNGTAGMRDSVAAQSLGTTKELVNKWLKLGYDKVYLLMDAKNPWADDPRVVMLSPTAANLRMVTGALAAAGLDANDNVEVMLEGHGGGEGKSHFIGKIDAVELIDALALIPQAAQRIIRMSQCHSASISNMKGLRDDNDLLIGYAGNIGAGLENDPKDKDKSELNWTDGRNLGVINATDVDGDGELSNWEMFWSGIDVSVRQMFPLTRGFVFDPGPNYVDYGFGTKPLPKPFPAEVIWAKSLVDYIELVGKGYSRGITVTFSDCPNGMHKGVYPKLDALAKGYNGWVQFVAVPSDIAGPIKMYCDKEGADFQVRFAGEGQSYLERHFFTFDRMKELLHGLLHGDSPKAK